METRVSDPASSSSQEKPERVEEEVDPKSTDETNNNPAKPEEKREKDTESPLSLLDPFTISEEECVVKLLENLKLLDHPKDESKLLIHQRDLKKLVTFLGGTFALELISNFLNQLPQFQATCSGDENLEDFLPQTCLKALDPCAFAKFLDSDIMNPEFPLSDATILTTIERTVEKIRESKENDNGRINASRIVERLAFTYGERILRCFLQIAASASGSTHYIKNMPQEITTPPWASFFEPVGNLVQKYFLGLRQRSVQSPQKEINEEEEEENKKKPVKKMKKRKGATLLETFAEPVKDFYALMGLEADSETSSDNVLVGHLFEILCKVHSKKAPLEDLELGRSIGIKLMNLGKYRSAHSILFEISEDLRLNWRIPQTHPRAMMVTQSLAEILEKLGRWKEAMYYTEILTQQRQTQLGPEDPETLKSEQLQVELLYHQGEYEKSQKLCEKIFQSRQKNLGPFHPLTLTTEHCLVLLHFEQSDDTAEVLEKFNKIFETFQTTLKYPDTHPKLLAVVQSIAICHSYEKRDEDDQVQRLLKDIVEKYKKNFGIHQHPSGLFAEELLANFYIGHNRTQEASEILDKLLPLYTLIYGDKKSPRVTALRESMANILMKKEKYEEAQDNLLLVCKWRKKIFGPSHKLTIHSQHTLITAFSKNEKDEEALKILREIFDARQSNLGDHHDLTVMARWNLAKFLQHQFPDHQERLDEAENIYDDIYQKKLTTLGPHHIDTVKARSNMASMMVSKNKLQTALEMYRQIHEAKVTLLGAEDMDTLSSLGIIAWILFKLNDDNEQKGTKEALKLFEDMSDEGRLKNTADNCQFITQLYNESHQLYTDKKFAETLEAMKKLLNLTKSILGPEHHDTANMVANIGTVLHQLGRYGEAVGMYEDAVEIHKKYLDTNPLLCIGTMQSMASMLAEQGKYTMATRLLDDTCGLIQNVYGDEEHPLILKAKHLKGIVMNSQDKKKEANELLEQVLEVKRRVLGPKHPDTMETDHQISLNRAQERMARSRFFRGGGFGGNMMGGLFGNMK